MHKGSVGRSARCLHLIGLRMLIRRKTNQEETKFPDLILICNISFRLFDAAFASVYWQLFFISVYARPLREISLYKY